jgi:hypothetical protein
MGQQDLIGGLARIWSADRLALFLALILVFIQLLILLAGYRKTIRAVRRATLAIRQTARAISDHGFTTSALDRVSLPEVRRALHAAHDLVERGSELDREEIAEIFAASRLLPASYNSRWDAAAPGVFTAIGILGTFLGLIVGFLRVDPSDASNSVGPLLGGMVVAFFNSFIGVLLSILWTYRSRQSRHEFEAVCKDLLHAVSDQLPNTSLGQRSVAHLKRVEEGIAGLTVAIDQLAKKTQESSAILLDNLSQNVGASFEALVNKPFEQVNASIGRFNELIQSAAEVHEQLLLRLESTARRIDEGGARLGKMFEAAHECVDEFGTATLHLRESSKASASIVAQTQSAAEELRVASTAVGNTAGRIVEVAQVMQVANAAMTSTANSLTVNSTAFERSTERFEKASGELQGAVSSLRDASNDVVETTTRALTAQLDSAITAMSESLTTTGQRTIAAYELSANRVVEAVAENMTELIERLTANLATLGSQIGEQSDSMSHVIGDIKRQVEFAARNNRESLDQLAKATPEVIKAQLSEFDRALAKAVDHFSGTLEQWDGKLSGVEDLTAALRNLSDREVARLRLALADGNGAVESSGAAQ